MAFRLSLTLAGSYSVSSARAARPQAIAMANNAIPNQRRIVFPLPCPVLSVMLGRDALVLKLAEAALGVGRAELGGLLVPKPRGCRIGRDAARVLGPEQLRVIGPRQYQRGLSLRIRRPLEQQPGGGDVADRKQVLR